MTGFSYQLYSSRNFPTLADTLSMLAKLGYAQVEGFGGLYASLHEAAKLRGLLDQNGLTMPTGHIAVDVIESDPDRTIALARKLGLKAVIAPFLSPDLRPGDAAGWAAFGKRLGEAAKPILDAGLYVGWHNHDFEMAKTDGEYVLDLILAGSEELSLELDLAWVTVGGEDPTAWIEKYADRLLSVHLKDIAAKGEAADEDGWADVGYGIMDWKAIWPALRTSACRYFVVEHDNPKDHARFARRSLNTVTSF